MHESDLPDELWIQIFFILREHGSILYSWDWIIVTHVCRRWRRIAVDCLSLWTSPDFSYHSKDRMETFLSRLGNVPVTVDDRQERDDDTSEMDEAEYDCCVKCNDNVAFVIRSGTQLRQLHLENFDPEVLNYITPFQFSTLEELDLRTRDRSTPPILLQNKILYESTPTLKVVNLKGYIISSDSVLLRGLVQLCMTDNYSVVDEFDIRSELYPSIDELLSILKACPNLEVLKLKFVKNSTVSATPVNQVKQRTLIPSLQSFTLDQIDLCAARTIAECVNLPNLRNLDLGLRYLTWQETLGVVAVLRQLVKNISHDYITVVFKPYAVDVIAQAGPNDAVLDLTVISLFQVNEGREILSARRIDHTDIVDILAALVHEQQLSNPLSLTLEFQIPCNCNYFSWSSFFGTIPKLERLDLSLVHSESDDYAPIYFTIRDTIDKILEALNESSILPELKRLTLVGFEVKILLFRLSVYLFTVRKSGKSLNLVLKNCTDRKKDWLNSEDFDPLEISWVES